MERAATADETAQIRPCSSEAMAAGAFGFSTTVLNQHMGSRAAAGLPKCEQRRAGHTRTYCAI